MYLTGERLQDHVFNNIYKKALQDEKCMLRLQLFRMVLCGVPRSGKTTFWKRLAIKDFKPSEVSISTGVAESHYLLVQGKTSQESNVHTEMLFHLYSEDIDLDYEALTIYKHILSTHEPQFEEVHRNQAIADISLQSALSANSRENQSVDSPQSEVLSSELVAVAKDPIVTEIDRCFEELTELLKRSETVPDIPDIKKMCHVQEIGGQRVFMELLPAVSMGKALYLIFFNYENFGTSITETVQMKGNPTEMPTGAAYEQMDVIMQSLICVSSTKSSDNVALLVGTHVDKVQSQYIDYVNSVIYEKVQPFLSSNILMYAESGSTKPGKENLVLKVAIHKNKMCSHEPEDYKQVVMHIVDKKLSCPESEALPASWYMFSIILRRIQHAGHSVLRYNHCQHIAKKLYIQPSMLQSLLFRLHKVLGIAVHFPEVKELVDIVICDPAFIYKSISELIFNSFDDRTSAQKALRLKKWGMLEYEELKKHSKVKNQLEMNKLMILLQHLGIIAPVQNSMPTAEPEHKDDVQHHEYLIPCILKDAKLQDLEVQIQDTQACSIVPLRIDFDWGFAPMGGFCYLFTKLMSKWKIRLPDELEDENNIYWRNKVTFEVEEIYSVTLLSTDKYYEIHIVHSESEQPFQLETDGYNICKKVWDAIHTILENSRNESLHNYKTACICTISHQEHDQHVMKFNSKPHEIVPRVEAQCTRNGTVVNVKETQPSVMVWFKVWHYQND